MNLSQDENVAGRHNKKSRFTIKKILGLVIHLVVVILLSNYLFTLYDKYRGDLLFITVIVCYSIFTISIIYHIKTIVKL